MKNKKTTAQMTAHEIAFKCITSTIDALRFKIGIPPSEILKVLADATTVIGFELGGRAGVDAAVQMVRNRTKLVEDTHKILDANAGEQIQ